MVEPQLQKNMASNSKAFNFFYNLNLSLGKVVLQRGMQFASLTCNQVLILSTKDIREHLAMTAIFTLFHSTAALWLALP